MRVFYVGEHILQTSPYLAHFLRFGPTKPVEINADMKMHYLFLEEQKENMCQVSTWGAV